jgi:SAM-dependent methyltransferase
MSAFSALDDAPDPDRFLRYLDEAAQAEAGIKHYVMAAHALRKPVAPILDLGCGGGHDLVLLDSVGLRPIGVDVSLVALRFASGRTTAARAPLVQGAGERLPFRDGAFGGCRMERVLMHVADPAVVVAEVVRCVDRGGIVTAFEPDWSSFRVRGADGDEPAGWMVHARHPAVGALLWDLLETSGCEVLDRVEERSVWRSLGVLDRVVGGLDQAVARAIALEKVSADHARQWLDAQRSRDAEAGFYSTLPKILIVARTR